MNFGQKHKDTVHCSNKKKTSSKIEKLLNEIKDRGIFAFARLSEENQVIITKWAYDISDRYVSVLKKYPTKIKDISGLPASKQELKMAIKILLTAPVVKKSEELVDTWRDRFVSIGAFQDIDPDDKEKMFEQDNNIEKEMESTNSSEFSKYHKYMEVIISEQNALLDDVNNFINDLNELKKGH